MPFVLCTRKRRGNIILLFEYKIEQRFDDERFEA